MNRLDQGFPTCEVTAHEHFKNGPRSFLRFSLDNVQHSRKKKPLPAAFEVKADYHAVPGHI